MSSKKGFANSLKLTKTTFFISGIEIDKEEDTRTSIFKWLFHFNMLWLYTDVFGEFFWLIEGINMRKSLADLSMVAPCTTMCLLATSKVLNIYLYKDVLDSAVTKLRELYPSYVKEGTVETQILEQSMKFLNAVVLFLSACCVVVTVAFSVMPLILMGNEYYHLGYTELKLPFLTKYFFDSYANKMIWSFVYLHQVWSSKYSIFLYERN